MSRASWLRLILIAALLVAVAVLPFVLPVQEPIRNFLDWVRKLGVWGPVVLALFWIPSAVLLIPGTLVTLAGGALFPLPQAVIAISLGSTAGACTAFLVGRGVARPWVERQVAGSAKFRAIDRAIGEQGFRIVLLLRLSPVFPYNFLNYALALTRVTFRDFFLASWLGMFPATVLYVYIGSTLGELAALFTDRQRRVEEYVFYLVGLAVTVAVTVYVTRLARRALHQAIADAGPPPEEGP